MVKTRSQRTLIGRNKNPFYWLIGERTKLQRRTQLQRYKRAQMFIERETSGYETGSVWCQVPRSGSFPSSPGPLIQNEGSCSAFDMEIIFHSRVNKICFHKKGCAPSLILKVGVCGTRKWPRCNCKWGPSALFTAFQQNYPSHQLVVTPNEMVAFTTVITD